MGATVFSGQDSGAADPAAGLSEPRTALSILSYSARTSHGLTLVPCFPNPPSLEIFLPNHRNDTRLASWQTHLQPALMSPKVRLSGNQIPTPRFTGYLIVLGNERGRGVGVFQSRVSRLQSAHFIKENLGDVEN